MKTILAILDAAGLVMTSAFVLAIFWFFLHLAVKALCP